MIDTGFTVIGTRDDYVAQIANLTAQSGGFGCFLHLDTHWADWAETKRSYELIARVAIPRINKLNANRFASETWPEEQRTVQGRAHRRGRRQNLPSTPRRRASTSCCRII
jgi:limonene 1,2-monooxygenase